MSEDDIIDSAAVPGWPFVYVIGSFDSRITFFSQQVRGFNLAYALMASNALDGKSRIAVIGAGAGGLSVAAGLALLMPGVVVDIFEREQYPLHLQHGCTRRNLHPHIYDWPRNEASNPVAGLPYLDWSAKSASDVAEEVMLQFQTLQIHLGSRVNLKVLSEVSEIKPTGQNSYLLSYMQADHQDPKTGAYHAVFLAIGFGAEIGLPGADSHSYWSDRGTPDAPRYASGETVYLISGAGDGALIDLCAAAIQDFDHAWIIEKVMNWPGVDALRPTLELIDAEAESFGPAYDFMEAYDAAIGAQLREIGLVDEIAKRLRHRSKFIFNTHREQPLSQPTATLNRFLVYLVFSAAKQASRPIQHLIGALTANPGEHGNYDVAGKSIHAKELFVRHGAARQSAFSPFDSIRSAYQSDHERWLLVDQKRQKAPHMLEGMESAIESALVDFKVPVFVRDAGAVKPPEKGWSLEIAFAANVAWLENAFTNRSNAKIFLRQPLCPGDTTETVRDRNIRVLNDQFEGLLRGAAPAKVIAVTGLEGSGKSWLVAQKWLSLPQKPLTLFITAEDIGEARTDPRSLIARKLSEQTGRSGHEGHKAFWSDQLIAWHSQRQGPAQGMLVILDGLNQRPKVEWGRTIDLLCEELGQIGGMLIVTSRKHYFDTDIQPALASSYIEVDVPEWTPLERDELLRDRGVFVGQLQPRVAESLLNPRLLGIALTLLDGTQLQAMEELSIPRLLFEHLRASQRDGYGPSAIEFKRSLQDHAKEVLQRLSTKQQDDLNVFDGGLQAVVDGRFFVPLPDDQTRYTVHKDGLVLALGLAIVNKLSAALRNKRDLDETLIQLTEPVASLDQTSEAVLAALTVACIEEKVSQEIGVAIITAFATMQNPDERSLDAFAALARVRPQIFLDAAKALALLERRPANFDWIAVALNSARADEVAWRKIAPAIKGWLACITLDIEQAIFAFGRSEQEISQEREKLKSALNAKISDLSDQEQDIFLTLTETEAKDVSLLGQLAIGLLAGKSLEPFAEALVQWCFAKSLNGGHEAPAALFRQLICFNGKDWASTRAALLRSSQALRSGTLSITGKRTLVTVLQATGAPDDAQVAQDLVDLLLSGQPKNVKRRPNERYCLTDPCAPENVEPENVADTADAYAAIDVTKLKLKMGMDSDDRYFDEARVAVARFYPDKAIERHRALAADVMQRRGLPLRQGIVHLLENSSLVTGSQAQQFVSRVCGSESDLDALRSLGEEERVWTIFHLEIAFPALNALEQLDALLHVRFCGDLSDQLIDMIKPLTSWAFQARLDDAIKAQHLDAQATVLLFAPFRQVLLSQEARLSLPVLLRSESALVRSFAMRMIAQSRDVEALRLALEYRPAHNAGTDWVDGLERWHTSEVMLEASMQGVEPWQSLVSRIECAHLGQLASRLGVEAARYSAGVVDSLLQRGLSLPVESDSLDIQVRHWSGGAPKPRTMSLSQRKQPPANPAEAFERQFEEQQDFDEHQRNLNKAFDRLRAFLTSHGALDLLHQFSLGDFSDIVAADRDLATRWCSQLLDMSNDQRLGSVRNMGLLLAREIAAYDPINASHLFVKLDPVRPLVRVVFGHEEIEVGAMAIWSAKDSSELVSLRSRRLDRAVNNDELAREVWAALWNGKEVQLKDYIDAQLNSERPAVQARAIFVAGLMDSNSHSDFVLDKFRDVPGLLGRTQSISREIYQRSTWTKHWYAGMWSAASSEDFWSAAVLFLEVADGRVELLRPPGDAAPVYQLYWSSIERQVRNRFDRTRGKWKKQLFAEEAPWPPFLRLNQIQVE